MMDLLNHLRRYRFLPYWVIIGLSVLILWNSWQFYRDQPIALNAVSKTQNTKSDDIGPPRLSDLDHPLFGYYVDGTAKLQESSSDVKLVGIVYSANPKQSYLMVEEDNGQLKRYTVGDTLEDGIIIKSINKTGAVILYKGRLESLALPVEELEFQPKMSPLQQESL